MVKFLESNSYGTYIISRRRISKHYVKAATISCAPYIVAKVVEKVAAKVVEKVAAKVTSKKVTTGG